MKNTEINIAYYEKNGIYYPKLNLPEQTDYPTAKHSNLNASNNFVLITDSESNVAYELHTYAPTL